MCVLYIYTHTHTNICTHTRAVYLIRNTEAVTRATEEIWSPRFCIVAAECSFAMFHCEPTVAVQAERAQKTRHCAPSELGALKIEIYNYIFKYGSDFQPVCCKDF